MKDRGHLNPLISLRLKHKNAATVIFSGLFLTIQEIFVGLDDLFFKSQLSMGWMLSVIVFSQFGFNFKEAILIDRIDISCVLF